jgi:hypothetical protein
MFERFGHAQLVHNTELLSLPLNIYFMIRKITHFYYLKTWVEKKNKNKEKMDHSPSRKFVIFSK